MLDLWPVQDTNADKTTFLAIAAQMGRIDIFNTITNEISKYSKDFREAMAISLLFTNDYGDDLEQYCYCEIDYDKFGISREKKVLTALLV